MVKSGEKSLRINACFEKEEHDSQPPPSSPKKKHWQYSDTKFRKVSVFDISQTREIDAFSDNEVSATLPIVSAGNIFEIARLEGSVMGYENLLSDLNEVSPLPLVLSRGVKTEDSIIINKDMSQLHTIRTIINQIVRYWIGESCHDKEQLEIETESVAFIVFQYLNLDTSDFSFHHIARYSLARERNRLEDFLDNIQKTALYFIDTYDGVRAAHCIGYTAEKFFMFANRKTALRLFRQGYLVYLIYPGQGELLAMSKKEVEQYDGPFAVPSADWFSGGLLAA